MIDFQDARDRVMAAALPLPAETLATQDGLGRHLAADIRSPMDHPVFDQSAVDGYALRFEDIARYPALAVADTVRAGDAGERTLAPGECCRIFTGAPLPPGADTIVMQELVERTGDAVRSHDAGLRLGGNVRKAGEQLRAGELALAAGTRLDAAALGFLRSLGIREVTVARQPRVRIIVTGDEFAETEADFRRGRIYESNGLMLQAALAAMGIAATYQTCRDDPSALAQVVGEDAAAADLLLLTGGVSVGDYDFSRGALEANGFEAVFHNVAQKPGKPLLFCQRGGRLAFGFPGNPRASLVCFYLFALPLIQAMQGARQTGLRAMRLPLAADFSRKLDGKTHLVTAAWTGAGVRLLQGQQSHMLQSVAQADLIVVLPADRAEIAAGSPVDCFLLP